MDHKTRREERNVVVHDTVVEKHGRELMKAAAHENENIYIARASFLSYRLVFKHFIPIFFLLMNKNYIEKNLFSDLAQFQGV